MKQLEELSDVNRADAVVVPLNVCFVIDRLAIGGTERQLLALIQQLDRRRFRPLLCLLDGNDAESASLEPQDCPVIRLGIASLVSLSTLNAAWRFIGFLRSNHVDIIQTHFPDSTYFSVPLAWVAGVKKIIRTRRDLFYWVTPAHHRIGRVIDGFYNRFFVDALIANCEAAASAGNSSERPPARCVKVIHNGVDLAAFQNLPIPVWRAPFRIGVVAMLRPEKRLDVLIQAVAILANKGIDLYLHIGGDGLLRDELSTLSGNEGVLERVHFHGKVSEIPQFLQQLHVAVLCSDTEALSNAAIEYMAAGRAVVLTAVGGNVELIEHEKTGILISPSDPVQLAAAIERLISDPQFSGQMGRNARIAANKSYSMAGMVECFDNFYQELARGS